MAPEAVQVPEAPAILPAKLQAQWKKTYSEAMAQAQADEPDDWPRQRMLARREANRLLRVPNLTGYEQAMALEDWQVVFRGQVDGVLKVVTSDGKKYRFPVPAHKAQAAAAREREENERSEREAKLKAEGGQK